MTARGLALIVVAVLLSVGLLGVQLASGGNDYVPQRAADPCQDRGRTDVPDDLESLAEAVVLTGLDDAACRLGVSRERLLLALLTEEDRRALAREAGTDEAGLERAIKQGLRTGVDRLERTGRLPEPSVLLPEAAQELGVPDALVGLVPDGLLDDVVSTADLLRWTVDQLDVGEVLAGLESGESLDAILEDAIVQGAKDEALRRLRDALPGPLEGLFG